MSLKGWDYNDILRISLIVSVLLYIAMFVLLGTVYDIYSADFFHVSISSNETNYDSNPKVLGVPLRNMGEYIGLNIFFFVNAFLGVWNSIVVDSLFGLMVFDENDDIVKKLKEKHPNLLWIFVIYDIWRSARNFFNILGIFSNVIFFISTTAGLLAAGILTKRMYLNKDGIHLLKEDFTNSSSEIEPLVAGGNHILKLSVLKNRSHGK